MRPSTSRDRKRLVCNGFVVLVASMAFATPTIGDGPANDEPRGARPDVAAWVKDRVDRLFHDVRHALIVNRYSRDQNPWLQKEVVLKSLKTNPRVDGQPVPIPGGRAVGRFWVRGVEKGENGERLQLNFGSFKGWVEVNEVVLEDQADAYFSELIRRGPPSAEAYFLRGSLREGDDSLMDLTEAIRLDPRFAAAYSARAGVYVRKKDNPRALADYSEAIRLDLSLLDPYTGRASIYLEEKKYDEAIADLSEAIRLDPDDSYQASLLSARASVFCERKEWDRAIVDLTEAIRLAPRDQSAFMSDLDVYHFQRGYAYNHCDQYDLAIADFGEAVQIAKAESDFPRTRLLFASLYNRANAWDAKKDYARAIAGFTEVIDGAEERGDRSMVYMGRARARKHSKDFDGALADYAEALRHDPLPIVAAISYVSRSHIESDRGDPQAALADCDRAVGLVPKNPWILVGRAYTLNLNRRHAPALADCDRAVEVEPENAWGHDFRAWIRATCPDPKFRDGKKAVEGATLACDLTSWKNSSCLETLAAAQAESGDFDSAVKWQARALELAKDDETKAQARDRLELFRKKQPFRDVRPANVDRRASHPIPEIPLTAR